MCVYILAKSSEDIGLLIAQLLSKNIPLEKCKLVCASKYYYFLEFHS